MTRGPNWILEQAGFSGVREGSKVETGESSRPIEKKGQNGEQEFDNIATPWADRDLSILGYGLWILCQDLFLNFEDFKLG